MVVKRRVSKKRSQRKSKKAKGSKKVSKNMVSYQTMLKKVDVTALCMKCYHKSGRKMTKSKISLKGRKLEKNSKGRVMLKGFCAVCGGKMNKFI